MMIPTAHLADNGEVEWLVEGSFRLSSFKHPSGFFFWGGAMTIHLPFLSTDGDTIICEVDFPLNATPTHFSSMVRSRVSSKWYFHTGTDF